MTADILTIAGAAGIGCVVVGFGALAVASQLATPASREERRAKRQAAREEACIGMIRYHGFVRGQVHCPACGAFAQRCELQQVPQPTIHARISTTVKRLRCSCKCGRIWIHEAPE